MNKSHQTAYNNGFNARRNGRPRSDCPYNIRAVGGRNGNIPTGSRGFARAWLKGWHKADGSESGL